MYYVSQNYLYFEKTQWLPTTNFPFKKIMVLSAISARFPDFIFYSQSQIIKVISTLFKVNVESNYAMTNQISAGG